MHIVPNTWICTSNPWIFTSYHWIITHNPWIFTPNPWICHSSLVFNPNNQTTRKIGFSIETSSVSSLIVFKRGKHKSYIQYNAFLLWRRGRVEIQARNWYGGEGGGIRHIVISIGIILSPPPPLPSLLRNTGEGCPPIPPPPSETRLVVKAVKSDNQVATKLAVTYRIRVNPGV